MKQSYSSNSVSDSASINYACDPMILLTAQYKDKAKLKNRLSQKNAAETEKKKRERRSSYLPKLKSPFIHLRPKKAEYVYLPKLQTSCIVKGRQGKVRKNRKTPTRDNTPGLLIACSLLFCHRRGTEFGLASHFV